MRQRLRGTWILSAKDGEVVYSKSDKAQKPKQPFVKVFGSYKKITEKEAKECQKHNINVIYK